MPNDTKTIPLTQGYVAVVDAEDYEELSKFRWCVARHKSLHVYAVRREQGTQRRLRMHRVITNAPSDLFVDHINHDGLDNRRANLRLCTNAENVRNRRGANKGSSSKYVGVSWHMQCGKWVVQIRIDGKISYLGLYTDEIEAALAYDKAAREHYGEFASPNFSEH